MINNFRKLNKNKGSLLLELLIVISLVAIILSVSANAMFLSMRSNKSSGERDIASALASETLEATRSIVEEDWQNIYSLTKGTQQNYYPTQFNGTGKWVLNTGDETKTLNNIIFTRYITIDNVSRDSITRNIQNIWSSADDDPSTQKVTVTVSWTGGTSVVISEYFFRWKNKICGQTGWATGGSGNNVQNCTDTSYDTKDPEINFSLGTGISIVIPVCGVYSVVGLDGLSYGTVLGEDGKCWLDRNLGATRVATLYNDSQSYGDLYQWGRGGDDHQIPTGGNTTILSATDQVGSPDTANFIKAPPTPYDWRSPQNNNLWQGVSGVNNPCPNGFRLPTQSEWAYLVTKEGITNYTTAYTSTLKLTAAGYRNLSDAGLRDQGSYGYYWSSTITGTNAYDLSFNSTAVNPVNNTNRANGVSVRCIAN